MSTYIIFAGDGYYPCGGFFDFYGATDSFKEALEIYQEALEVGSKPKRYFSWNAIYIEDKDVKHKSCPRDWAHIVNIKTRKLLVNSNDT